MEPREEAPKKKVLPPMLLSVLIGVVGILVVVLCGVAAPAEPADFSAGAELTVEQAQAAFDQTGTNEDLYALLITLCYQDQQNPGSVNEALAQYGTQLYDRAKAGTLDLETIGDQKLTTEVLSVLKKLGIRP